ncbi:MAG TPA: 3-ketoacyl-ACP reductase [Acidobacteriaceae bacterium]|jgi:NAD(P)-dependent dehydrogenase (short-subunit alcohol dehydrogenase family)|nr:3-ketoacyl-ACP reductase [Acidobacteriaceae bacterium]
MGNKDRVALVTGGTRGIGLGVALKLAEAGFTLAITGRRPAEQVQPVLEQLKKRSPLSIYVVADVASAVDRKQLLATIEAQLGRLDVLVNNAGIAPRIRADVLDASEESFDELIATNLRGPYFLTQSVAAWMIRQPGQQRSIINISSVSATVASVNRGDYCISKAGIAMATKLWAARLAEYGIGVYEIRPGIIETDMTEGVKGKYDALIEGGILLERRWGTPEDIGTAASMLARGELPYATGAVLVLDGGLTLARL